MITSTKFFLKAPERTGTNSSNTSPRTSTSSAGASSPRSILTSRADDVSPSKPKTEKTNFNVNNSNSASTTPPSASPEPLREFSNFTFPPANSKKGKEKVNAGNTTPQNNYSNIINTLKYSQSKTAKKNPKGVPIHPTYDSDEFVLTPTEDLSDKEGEDEHSDEEEENNVEAATVTLTTIANDAVVPSLAGSNSSSKSSIPKLSTSIAKYKQRGAATTAPAKPGITFQDDNRTRRHSRAILLNKAHKKRPKSINPSNQTISTASEQLHTPISRNDYQSFRRLTVHGSRLSTVYLSDNKIGGKKSKKSNMERAYEQELFNNVQYQGSIFLPDELLYKVLCLLEPEDLGRVSAVCKRWCILADSDLLWEAIVNVYYPLETERILKQSSRKSFTVTVTKHEIQTSSNFFKNIFIQEYLKDLHLLKTGTWRNTSWRPKKSPWSKDDYSYVHNNIINTSNHKGSIPIKVVVVGDGAVGKTSLLARYANDEFQNDYVPTIFDNFTTHIVYQNQSYNVSLWDTAGPEDYDKLRPLSYIGADIFLLCIDLVNAFSLPNISQRWTRELSRHAPGVPIYLCGTKMDIRVDRYFLEFARKKNPTVEAITYEKGLKMAKDIGAVGYSETSALTGQGVKEVFEEVMRYGCQFFLHQFKARKSSCEVM